MSAKISDLQERQIVNIADGKCLGNIKDIELNISGWQHSGVGITWCRGILEFGCRIRASF